MTAPAIFHQDGVELRVIDIDGEPWFVATDVCAALGYVNGRHAVATHVHDDDRNTVVLSDGIPGNPNKTAVNESGMYALIFGSTLAKARDFKRWVTHEVLPQIRKTGAYGATPAIPSSFAEALELAAAQAREIEALEAQAEIAAPKVEAFDMFMDANGSMSMNEAAKTLGVGQNGLFKLLREAGVLIDGGVNHNLPMQRFAHHFDVVQSTYEHPRNGLQPTSTTRVRPSGLAFIARKLGLGHPSSPPAPLALVSG